MWSAFLVTAERGVYFATSRGSFIGSETALESEVGGTCGKGPGEGSLGPGGFVHPLRGVAGGCPINALSGEGFRITALVVRVNCIGKAGGVELFEL